MNAYAAAAAPLLDALRPSHSLEPGHQIDTAEEQP